MLMGLIPARFCVFLKGMIFQHTGNSHRNSPRRMLVCELLVCKMVVMPL